LGVGWVTKRERTEGMSWNKEARGREQKTCDRPQGPPEKVYLTLGRRNMGEDPVVEGVGKGAGVLLEKGWKIGE